MGFPRKWPTTDRSQPGVSLMSQEDDGSKSPAVVVDRPAHDPEASRRTSGTESCEQEEDEDNPEIAGLPVQVRQLVSLTDDPTFPTITFRYFVLSVIFVVPGAFLSQMSNFRTTHAPYSIFFVQIAAHFAGHFMARVMPAWTIRIPCTTWSFSLNPGPWSIKEHVLVTLTAASGATENRGYLPIAMAELWYGERVNPAVAIFFMFGVDWMGYAFASIARQVLLYDPVYIWPQALMQTTLFETFRKQDVSSPIARRQLKIFFLCLIGMTLWQFLPEYAFPFTSSLALLCWVAPHNPVANFVGAGLGGMGFLNLSLDWSNIGWGSSSILLTPWWTQVILFVAFTFSCWVLLPAAKWGGLGSYKHGLMSNDLFMANGTKYPVLDVMTPDLRLNETAFAQYGPMYMGTHNVWATFFDYGKVTSATAWILTFGFLQIKGNLDRARAARSPAATKNGEGINHQYSDRLNILQRQYKEVPLWWYALLFLAALLVYIVPIACGHLWIPVWTVFVGLASSAVLIVPFAWLYAISNYKLHVGSFNELMYGYMVQTDAGEGHRHPCGPSTYGVIASGAWSQAQRMLQDQKIGHYMHIPPRTVFFSQIFGTILGVPINYAVVRWVINTKGDYITGAKHDPLHQWTGQTLLSYKTEGVLYALLGPDRVFGQAQMRPLPWSFLVGGTLPPILYVLHRFLPRLRIDLWNVSIFFSGMAHFYGNVSTGYTSSIIGGYVVMYWAYRKRFQVWKRYSYMIAAAFDAGFNLNMLLIFLIFGSGNQISMPHWWGNNADSVERCFALPTD